jgi:hypothetical protein
MKSTFDVQLRLSDEFHAIVVVSLPIDFEGIVIDL